MSTSDKSDLDVSLFERAFEVFPRKTLLVDSQGTILAVNFLARESVQKANELASLVGSELSDIFTGQTAALTRDIFFAASGSPLILQLKGQKGQKGNKISFHVKALKAGKVVSHFLLSEAESNGIHSSFAKLTIELRNANDQAARIRRRNQRLLDSYDELEKFSHTAAHDLRAPLRSIQTLLGFFSEDYGATLPDEGKEMLQKVSQSAERLQILIADLLRHARSNTVTLERRLIKLDDMISAIKETLSPTLQEIGGQLIISSDLGELDADPLLLQQLFENLISNSIKYRKIDEPVAIKISREKGKSGQDILIVQDNGMGFENSFKTSLFEPFRRLHAHSEIEGSGIGLTTCKRICDRHKWNIEAHGEPGTGSTFKISFSPHASSKVPVPET